MVEEELAVDEEEEAEEEEEEEDEEEEEEEEGDDCLPVDENKLFLDALLSYDEMTGGRSSDDRYW